MGITVADLLSGEYFRDFKVISGRGGLHREIQGVTVADAPDGYRWKSEKELCFTSGYVFSKNPEFIRGIFQGQSQMAALVIKRERYLEDIPEYIVRLSEDNNVPLVTMPYGIPWMEVINQVYVAVINHAIQIFGPMDQSYRPQTVNFKEQKIRRILRAVESDMEFPALLYDLSEDKSYYSSENFPKITAEYQLQESDYWEPSVPHSRYTLCDSIRMYRIRLSRGESQGQPRISWVTIPIVVGGVPQAYFCVMESRRFLDFCDEYSVRIAYLSLMSTYEQLVALRDSNNLGFEQLLHMALDGSGEDSHRLRYQANQQGVSLEDPYIYVLFQHDHKSFDIRGKRDGVMELFMHCGMEQRGRMAFLSQTEGIILFRGWGQNEKQQILDILQEFQSKMHRKFEGMTWTFAVSFSPRRLLDIRPCVEKGRKILKIGRVAFPDTRVLDYDDLGILTWLDIPDEELRQLLDSFSTLMQAEKNRELLHTLKVYLENNMNYTLTAEKLFVNINTIRRRMEKVNELVPIDWNNYYTRLKIGLMLQFMQF